MKPHFLVQTKGLLKNVTDIEQPASVGVDDPATWVDDGSKDTTTSSQQRGTWHIPQAFTNMKSEDLQSWLKNNDLARLTSAFSQIDGLLLWQLKRMKDQAPEQYYTTLKSDFKMNIVEILKFNTALDNLS